MPEQPVQIGVVSDTHGYLDPRALPLLEGVSLIFHAGDIGNQSIIDRLRDIAPVVAVHGNTDAGTALGRQYPATVARKIDGVTIYITHIGTRPETMIRALPQPRPRVCIVGHTHVAAMETLDGVLFLNPGACGRPRFGGGVSIARLEIADGTPRAQILPL